MPKSKEEKKRQNSFVNELGLGENVVLQRAALAYKSPLSWSRGRIRHMEIPKFVYVLVDKRTGEAYKTKSREMPFYASIGGVKISLRNISAYRDISDFKIVQYELMERVVIDG